MKKILKSAIGLYFHNFWLFLKIIGVMLVPILILRLVMHYAYLGQLSNIYSILFAFIFSVLGIFVEFILISTSYKLLLPTKQQISLKKMWSTAKQKIGSFLYLKILISLIVISVPLLVGTIMHFLDSNPVLAYAGFIINLGWLCIIGLLLLFSSYALIVENIKGHKAIERSIELIRQQPYITTVKFIATLIIFGAVLIIVTSVTQVLIAELTDTTVFLQDPNINLWWEDIVPQIYLILSSPLIVCLTSVLYYNLVYKAPSKHK